MKLYRINGILGGVNLPSQVCRVKGEKGETVIEGENRQIKLILDECVDG